MIDVFFAFASIFTGIVLAAKENVLPNFSPFLGWAPPHWFSVQFARISEVAVLITACPKRMRRHPEGLAAVAVAFISSVQIALEGLQLFAVKSSLGSEVDRTHVV